MRARIATLAKITGIGQSKARNVFQKDRRRNLEIDYISMVQVNAIRVQLAVAVLVNCVFINEQANMATGAR